VSLRFTAQQHCAYKKKKKEKEESPALVTEYKSSVGAKVSTAKKVLLIPSIPFCKFVQYGLSRYHKKTLDTNLSLI
jgi:hypothetical protein